MALAGVAIIGHMVATRPVESKSLKVGKSLNIGKKSENQNSFLYGFFRFFGNLLKRSLIGTWT